MPDRTTAVSPAAAEQKTRAWLEQAFARCVASSGQRPVYDARGQPVGMTASEFGRLHRKFKIFRWLDGLRFDSFIDVGSGWEVFPYLVRQRYGAAAYYADLAHEFNLPADAPEFGHLDHAVTLKLSSLPFADAAFDVVLCSEVFEHLVRPIEAVSELLRITRKCLILTTLEGLSRSHFERALLHYRTDVRIPHVERNYLVLSEFAALFGSGLHHESLQHSPSFPADLLVPAQEQDEAAYAALRDVDALVTALARAAAVGVHGPRSLGILLVKVMPGAGVTPPRPQMDAELARWLVAQAALIERHASETLAGAPRSEVRRDRPIAPPLLARLRCPDCGGGFAPEGAGLRCLACGTAFAADCGVPILYPTRVDAGPSEEVCLQRLCGDDARRRRVVRRVLRRLRRNEPPPRLVRRLIMRFERARIWGC